MWRLSKTDLSGNNSWDIRYISDSLYISDVSIAGTDEVYILREVFRALLILTLKVALSTLKSKGNSDIFVCKVNSSGKFVWVKQMGGSNSEVGQSISLDANDNIYTTGNFKGTVDFDPGDGTSNLTSKINTDYLNSQAKIFL